MKINLMKNKLGTALITVILIVAVVSITAITMQGYLRGEISRAQMLLEGDELYNNLLGVEAWGLSTLSKIGSATAGEQSGIVPNFNLDYKNKDIILIGDIIEQTGLFNINALYNPNSCMQNASANKLDTESTSGMNNALLTKIFSNLLINLNGNTQLSNADTKEITANIQAWMCPENTASNKYKITNANLAKWEYQPSSQLIFDISELKLIDLINNSIYLNVKDKISVLPVKLGAVKIFNINAMSADLLAAIFGTDASTAQRYLDEVNKKPNHEKLNTLIRFIDNQKYYDSKEIEKLKTMMDSNKNQVRYFLIHAQARKFDKVMGLTTLVEVAKDIRIIWRKRGLNDNV